MVRRISRIVIGMVLLFLASAAMAYADESYIMYDIRAQVPDGTGGYYKTTPQISVTHKDKNYQTQYRLHGAHGKKAEGTLTAEQSQVQLGCYFTEDGSYELHTWMERKDGSILQGTERSRKIQMDTKAPEQISVVVKDEEGKTMFSKEVRLELSAKDEVSGVKGIYYRLGNEEERYVEGVRAYVKLPLGFQGKIAIRVVDQAGNLSETFYSEEYVCENTKPQIVLQMGNNDGWFQKGGKLTIQVKEDGIASGIQMIVVSQDGKEVQKKTFVNSGVKTASLELAIQEPGLLQVLVCDFAGNKMSQKQPIRIDAIPPVVTLTGLERFSITRKDLEYVCRVQEDQALSMLKATVTRTDETGKQWEENITEWVKEENQYVYYDSLNQDGIYEVMLEAVDAAGNRTVLKKQVIIDKTSPKFSGLEVLEGKELEFFSWKYDINQLVSELTSFDYELKLDGELLDKGKTYREPGLHQLELYVKDAAGNDATQKVRFRIAESKKEASVLEESQAVEEIKEEETKIKANVIKKEESINTKKENTISWEWILLGFTGCLLVASLAAYRRYQKRTHKKGGSQVI